MNVVIDMDLATSYPKHMKRLFEALSDKRDNVHFVAGVCYPPESTKDQREQFTKGKEKMISERREHIQKLGLNCVGFVGVVFGENDAELNLQMAAYCKDKDADMFMGSAAKAVKAIQPECLVLTHA